MNGIFTKVGNFVCSWVYWTSNLANDWIDQTIVKTSEMGKKLVDSIDGEDSIKNPFYWKKNLNKALLKEFPDKATEKGIIQETSEEKAFRLQKQLNRFQNFVFESVQGHIPLDARFILHAVYQHTKTIDPTFCALFLAEIAIPVMGNDQFSRLSLFECFLKILPECDFKFAVPLMSAFRLKLNGLELRWWNENAAERDFGHPKELTATFYAELEKKIEDLKQQSKESRSLKIQKSMDKTILAPCKNSSENVPSFWKIAFLAALMFSQISATQAFVFNDTKFFEDVGRWNFSEGPFPVQLQLQKQGWCKQNENFCQIPKNLIPNTMKGLSHFNWSNLRVDLNRTFPFTFYKNIFNGTCGNFSGNFTFTANNIHQSDWILSDHSSMNFDLGSVFVESSIDQNSKASSLSFSNGEINQARIGSKIPSFDSSDRSLSLSSVYVNVTRFSDISRLKVTNSLLDSTVLSGKISFLSVVGSLFNKATFNAQIDHGVMLETTLNEVEFGPYSSSLIVKDSPIINLQFFDSGQLVDSLFENITCLKLIRAKKVPNGQEMNPFDNCVFRNIETMEIRFNETRLFSPLFENVQLLKGSWNQGGFGSVYTCNQKEATMKAVNVFADFISFNAVDGGCFFRMTAARAKEWFEKHGVRFGPHVTFEGYGSGSSFTGFQKFTIAFCATTGSILLFAIIICCSKTSCRRNDYEKIPYETSDL